MQLEERDNPKHEIPPSSLEQKSTLQPLESEEEALTFEQEEMGHLAKQMWNLLQQQKPSVFYTMRKFKTLAPYLSRLEDVMILNVTKLCQTGTTLEEAKKVCLKEMMDELGLL